MALTKAHNRMIEGAAVNVKDFGAVGDGVTDDTAAIQAALNSLQNGSILDLVGGTYLIDFASRSNSSYLPSAILYVGGLNNIHIKNGKLLIDDSTSTQVMLHIHDSTNVTVSEMVFDGQFSSWSGAYNTSQFGLGITKSSKIKVFENVFANISNVALAITGDLSTANPSWVAEDAVISNNIFENYGQVSTSFMGVNNLTVESNTFKNARVSAFKYGSRQTNIDFAFCNNEISWDSGTVGYSDITGINGVVVTAELSTCRITGNNIDLLNCPVAANGINIGFDETNNNVINRLHITDNIISNGTGSSFAGFIHEGTLQVDVSSNQVHDIAWGFVVGTYGSGTSLAKTPFVTFSANRFYDVDNACIQLSSDAKAKAVRVTDNHVLNTAAKNYLFYADSNADNIDYIDIIGNTAILTKIPLRIGGVLNSISVMSNSFVGSTTASTDVAVNINSDSATGKFTIKNNRFDTFFRGIECVRSLAVEVGLNHFINCATAEVMNTNTLENHLLNTYDTVTTRLTQASPGAVTGEFSMASGSPNGVIYCNKGSTVRTSNASAGTMFYVKETDSANTGWVNK